MYCPGVMGKLEPFMQDERHMPQVVSMGVPPVQRMFVLYMFTGQEFLNKDPPLALVPEFMHGLQESTTGLVMVP
jgi:hypothetical protein